MENTTEYENVHENRKYKDTLFRIVFREKKDLLDLYNAVNGTTYTDPDERIMRLSDAFIKKDGCLECEAKLLNINYGHNRKLMEKCRRLEEYAIFVVRVKDYVKDQKYTRKQAINHAIDECIEEGILRDILLKNRSEVVGMVLTTFNKELYEKDLKEDAYEDGVSAGRAEGEKEKLLNLIRIKLAKGKSVEKIADALEEDVETIQKLIQELENN